MSDPTKICGTCKHWDIKNVRRTASSRIDKKHPARCLYPIKLPVLPDSATKMNRDITIHKSYMGYYDGQNCECWEERKEHGNS